MKLSATQKTGLNQLIASLRPQQINLISGANKERHIILSKLAGTVGPVLVITSRSAHEAVRQQYQRSLKAENEHLLFDVRTVSGPLAQHRVTPGVIVIDVRTEELPSALQLASTLPRTALIVWDYYPDEPTSSNVNRLQLPRPIP